jgi:5-methylcytosine-specific restriction endonuclease McrA
MPICRYCLKTRNDDYMIGRKCKTCVNLDYKIRLRKLRLKTTRYKSMKIDTAQKIHRQYGERFKHTIFPGDEDRISEIYRQSMYLRRKGMQVNVDHIVPIYNKRVCGLHVSWNLQIITQADNAAKGNRIDLDFESMRLFQELVLKGLAREAVKA